jgi:hypothetical protein
MEPIEGYNSRLLHIMSDDVLSKIKSHVASWEEDVPAEVVTAIKQHHLFGFQK